MPALILDRSSQLAAPAHAAVLKLQVARGRRNMLSGQIPMRAQVLPSCRELAAIISWHPPALASHQMTLFHSRCPWPWPGFKNTRQ